MKWGKSFIGCDLNLQHFLLENRFFIDLNNVLCCMKNENLESYLCRCGNWQLANGSFGSVAGLVNFGSGCV